MCLFWQIHCCRVCSDLVGGWVRCPTVVTFLLFLKLSHRQPVQRTYMESPQYYILPMCQSLQQYFSHQEITVNLYRITQVSWMSHLDETEVNTSRIDETLFDTSETKEHKPSLQCGTCGKILKSKGSLNLHVRRHTRDFNFSCQLCGESFLINQLLKEHVAKVHKKTGVVKCKFCGKVTTTFRGMREHVKEHAGEEHKCHDCDMSFSTKTKLKRHMSWHSKEFQCSICGKWFPSKGQLKIHSLIHDEHAQKYQCSHCNYVSIWKASVNRHVKTKHTDIRQHVCDKCGNGFKEKSTLTRHMQRNSCDRPRASSMWEEL